MSSRTQKRHRQKDLRTALQLAFAPAAVPPWPTSTGLDERVAATSAVETTAMVTDDVADLYGGGSCINSDSDVDDDRTSVLNTVQAVATDQKFASDREGGKAEVGTWDEPDPAASASDTSDDDSSDCSDVTERRQHTAAEDTEIFMQPTAGAVGQLEHEAAMPIVPAAAHQSATELPMALDSCDPTVLAFALDLIISYGKNGTTLADTDKMLTAFKSRFSKFMPANMARDLPDSMAEVTRIARSMLVDSEEWGVCPNDDFICRPNDPRQICPICNAAMRDDKGHYRRVYVYFPLASRIRRLLKSPVWSECRVIVALSCE